MRALILLPQTKYPPNFFVVSGHGGSGKSDLVKRTFQGQFALKGNEGRYLICGKFDQIRSSQPFSAIADAFSSLGDEVLLSEDIDQLRSTLMAPLGEGDPAILINAIPKLRSLLGDSDKSADMAIRKEFGFERLKLALRS